METLPRQGGRDAGTYQIAPGFAISAEPVPGGEYKISINITDNKATKTITASSSSRVAA